MYVTKLFFNKCEAIKIVFVIYTPEDNLKLKKIDLNDGILKISNHKNKPLTNKH